MVTKDEARLLGFILPFPRPGDGSNQLRSAPSLYGRQIEGLAILVERVVEFWKLVGRVEDRIFEECIHRLTIFFRCATVRAHGTFAPKFPLASPPRCLKHSLRCSMNTLVDWIEFLRPR